MLERVQQLRPIASSSTSRGPARIAWVLREPNVASAIVGVTRPEQVLDNAAASGVERRRRETLTEIDRILG